MMNLREVRISAHVKMWLAPVLSVILVCIANYPVDAYAAGKVIVTGHIPSRVIRGDEVVLHCDYEILVDEAPLYSVRWYKDTKEFYSFLPSTVPPKKAFNVPGARVDVRSSSDKRVVLSMADLNSSGTYKCEVSTEGPFFYTGSYEQEMAVIAMPKRAPEISGGKNTYRPGDFVHVNCTSGPSKPATEIMWYINGEKADGDYLIEYATREVEGSMEISTLGLKFQASSRHFPGGTLNLKCTATMASIYYQSGEKNATAHGHHAMLSSISGGSSKPSLSFRTWLRVLLVVFSMITRHITST